MAKRKKGQKDKQRSIKHTHNTKDRVARTPLQTGGDIRCSGRVSSSSSTSGTCCVNLGAISQEWRNDREVFTISATYTWLFVTKKFQNGQPSPHTFPNTKFPKETQLVRIDYRLDIKCFEIHQSNSFWTFIAIMGRVNIFNIFNPEWTSSHPKDHSCEVL